MKKILILTLVFVPLLMFGQNDIQLSQQFLSRMNYNPAATGASNYLNAFLLGRQQWIGWKDAPQTQLLNVHNYFDEINSGAGLILSNDKIAFTSTISAKLDYAYHIHFDNKSYLSLGLGAGIMYKNLDVNQLLTETGKAETDATLASYRDRYRKVNPDFDFGVEYNMEFLQVGASVTHLNLDPININNLQSGRHIYFYTKGTFSLHPNWKLSPAVVAHMSAWPIMQLDLNTIAYYRSRFWFGASVRVSDRFVLETCAGIVGLFVTDFLKLGYSYDYNPGPLKKYSGGSHEIMLGLRLGKGDARYGIKTPRFFE